MSGLRRNRFLVTGPVEWAPSRGLLDAALLRGDAMNANLKRLYDLVASKERAKIAELFERGYLYVDTISGGTADTRRASAEGLRQYLESVEKRQTTVLVSPLGYTRVYAKRPTRKEPA
jgi:hypothetical protein